MRARPDLLCLASGYGWLALGLLAFGGSLAAGRHQSIAIHLITVGGLGTLTLNVMAMSRLLKARHAPGKSAASVWGTALIAAAATNRVLGAFYPEPCLIIAALCWSAAFAILIALFWRIRRQTLPHANCMGRKNLIRRSSKRVRPAITATETANDEN